MKRYNPKDIEPKWQQAWQEQGIYHATEDSDKPKRYVLEYFPYPSGAAMHVGHVRNYTIGDAMARFWRMQGSNVLYPMGWDAFGLPAENYAIKTGISPRQAIDENTGRFKEQLIKMGFSHDWSREIDSTDPKYYKWTQWFFLMLHKRGLAYQQESLQWWCPHDKTVLANEQVEAGKCWRCGNAVEKKSLKQWFFKITDYADRLIDDLEDLDWSDAIKSMQRNWIGRSKGAEVDFKLADGEGSIQAFTTRPDTLFGATFMVLAPEHSLVKKITTNQQKSAVEAYDKESRARSDIERQDTDREKTGVFTGAFATNPVNNEKIPVWIADYVLPGYGTGAIMAVPAHDERDYEFAKKFDLPIREVVAQQFVYDDKNAPREGVETLERKVVDAIIKSKDGKYLLIVEADNTHFVGGGIEPEDEDELAAVRREVIEESGYTDIASIKLVSATINTQGYRYTKAKNQFSGGRFYEVILGSEERVDSEVEAGHHDIRWVAEDEVAGAITWGAHSLAWQQYRSGNTLYTGEGVMINSGTYDGLQTNDALEKIVADLAAKKVGEEKVNYKMRDWLISRQRYWGAPIPIIHCPKDGAVAVPDDQLPVELPELTKFEPSGDGRSPLANLPEFVKTTCPTCGGPAERETDTMDGFACSSWYFLRFADPHNDEKAFGDAKAKYWLPVDDYIGGAEHAVMHLLYARFWTKVMFDEGLIDFQEPFKALRNQGMILAPDGQKMSKSKGNTIEPETLIDQGYGADSIRIMELFIGPWNQSANWSVEGIGGAYRFLQRVWTICQEHRAAEKSSDASQAKELERATHAITKRVTEDLRDMSFNTAIAGLMEYVNEIYKLKLMMPLGSEQWQASLNTLLQLVAPFAPHLSEELWQQLGNKDSVHTSDWPTWDEKLLVNEMMKIAVQVNGKVRTTLELPANASQAAVVTAALANERVKAYVSGEPKKTIYILGRLLSLVV